MGPNGLSFLGYNLNATLDLQKNTKTESEKIDHLAICMCNLDYNCY